MKNYTEVHTHTLDTLWAEMEQEKGDLIARSREYARLTIPYICPEEGSAMSEQDKGDVVVGPRVVNHLANKIVTVMFPHDRPFFAVALTPEARQRVRKEMGPDKEAAFSDAVREEVANVEDLATRKLDLTTYRPVAVEAVKHQIITGNVCIVRSPTGRRMNYGVADFCIRRALDGEPIEIMLRDRKKFITLAMGIKAQLRAAKPHYKDTDDCVLYTRYYLREDQRWGMEQAVDMVRLATDTIYTKTTFPVIALTWNLARGENYGRGLVEDQIVGFHNIDVFTRSMRNMVVVAADIKFLVDPASTLDPAELNESAAGSYHQGREGDITTPEKMKNLPVDVVHSIISSWERELSQAFLLNSATVRDAERVTAEEIRFIAQELESAFGGLYSRLAMEWQKREADFAVSLINFDKELGAGFDVFEIVVTTGLESLSREGQLENLRRALADLSGLDTIPEDIRATLNLSKLAAFIFTNHTVRYKEFMFTQDEIAANQENQLAMAGRMEDMKAGGIAKAEAAKKAVQES